MTKPDASCQCKSSNSTARRAPAHSAHEDQVLAQGGRQTHRHAWRSGRKVTRWGVETCVSRGGRRDGHLDSARCVRPVPLHTPYPPVGFFFVGFWARKGCGVSLFLFTHVLHRRLDVYGIADHRDVPYVAY